MEQELRKLLRLQELDLEVIQLNKEQARITDELKDVNRHYQQATAALEKEQEKLKELLLEIKRIERGLESDLEKIRKLESQQSLVKTNKEYKALDKEIIDVRAHIALTEDQILAKMEENEEKQSLKKEHTQKIEEEKKLIAQKEKEINRKIDEIRLRSQQIQQQRETLADGVDKKLLRVYTRIFKNKKSRALVPIINKTCQGCHLTVPPNVEAQARRKEELIICENCSRILYYEQEEALEKAEPDQNNIDK